MIGNKKQLDYLTWEFGVFFHFGIRSFYPGHRDWDGVEMPNENEMPVFACRMQDGNKDPMNWADMWKCPGNCDVCKAAGRGCVAGEDSYTDEH